MGVVEIEETEGEDHGFHLYDLKCEKARDLIKHLADFFNRDMPPLIWFDLIWLWDLAVEENQNFFYSILSFKICCFWFVSVKLSSHKALSSLVTCMVCTNNNIVFLFKKWDWVFGSYICICVCTRARVNTHNHIYIGIIYLYLKKFANF